MDTLGNSRLTDDECKQLIDELSELKHQLKCAEDQLKVLKPQSAESSPSHSSTFDLGNVEENIYRSAAEFPSYETDQFTFCEAICRHLTEQSQTNTYAMLICEFSPTSIEDKYKTQKCMEQEARNIEAVINSATCAGTHIGYISHMERAIFIPSDQEGASAVKTADKLVRALSQHNWPGREGNRSVKCSIGIALYPGDSTNIPTLFRYADRALYNATRLDDSYYAFYR